MKKFVYLFLLSGVLSGLAACSGSKKESENRNASGMLLQDSADVHGIQRMQVSKVGVDIEYKGKKFHSSIQRTPNDDLTPVVSEMGETYADNQIVLRLQREGQEIFSKTFTKTDFASLVGQEFLSKSILEGMVYNKTSPEGILYAASICYPQTDLYVPITIIITADGKMSMRKDELLEDVYDTTDSI